MNAKEFIFVVVVLAIASVPSISPVMAQKMYWADSDSSKIQRADLDGSNVADIITIGLGDPRGIALDLQEPIDTTFTYQGELRRDGQVYNDTGDLRLSLWTQPAGGLSIGKLYSFHIDFVNGHFTLELDFGPKAFYGAQRWLEIAVKGSADADFVVLSPRQLLRATLCRRCHRLVYRAKYRKAIPKNPALRGC